LKINSRHTGVSKQDGFVLIVLVIVILLAISSYYFSTISLVEVQTNRIEKTQVVLKRAKKALLGYALTNWQVEGSAGEIGRLPCPDYLPDSTDGEQDGTCGGDYTNAIGYLPWKTLGLEVTRDNSGSCLLYAVSPAYKNSPIAALNPDSFGQFQIVDSAGAIIQGVSPEDRPVALIIAPGAALPNQTRVNNPLIPCGSYYADLPTLLAAYLDNDGNTNNAAVDTAVDNVMDRLVSKYANSDQGNNPVNDQIMTITYSEFWGINANQSANTLLSAIKAPGFSNRMNDLTEAVALCFAAYGDENDEHLPMPAALDLNGGEYRKSVDYDDSVNFNAGFAGRLPYDIRNANAVLDPGINDHIFKNAFCNNLVTTNETVNFTDALGRIMVNTEIWLAIGKTIFSMLYQKRTRQLEQ
jgi:type II secretory pathway pseudopilin PulG